MLVLNKKDSRASFGSKVSRSRGSAKVVKRTRNGSKDNNKAPVPRNSSAQTVGRISNEFTKVAEH